MPIDAGHIAEMFLPADGFRHPDWAQIIDWVGRNTPQPTPDTWNDIVRIWLKTLREDLGGGYAIHENSEAFLVADIPRDAARRLQKFASDAIAQMRNAWPGVAWEGRREKVVILLFSEGDDYYSYISRFYGEGQAPQSSGVWISDGYAHIAAQLDGEVGAAVTILHELCHDAFGHLNLPRWLDEAIARTLERAMAPRAPSLGESESDLLWGDVSGWKSPVMWAELADRHFAFWNSENIQEFWAGHTFHVPGEPIELSYSLAEVLLQLITERSSKQSFSAFLAGVGKHNDAGFNAARETLGLDLGEIAATFLGPGDWRPNPDRIAELTEGPCAEDDFAFDPLAAGAALLLPVDERPTTLQFTDAADAFAPATSSTTMSFSFAAPTETAPPVEFNSGVNEIGPFDAPALRAQLEQSGYAVFVLPPAAAENRRAFFDAVRATLPLNPPLRSDNWDAFSDSLFQGLVDHPAERIAILIPASPSAGADFTSAVEILSDIALGLIDPETTGGNPKHLAVVTG